MTSTKYPLAILAGLSLVGALAGCTTAAEAQSSTDDGTDPSGTTETGTGGATDAAIGDFADGTYTASGDYQAPSGTETVDVTVTLAGNTITAVEVVGHATDPQAMLMQKSFAGGIAAVVVGKSLDELQVDKVGGSSLTSGGFNKAIDEIKADAAA